MQSWCNTKCNYLCNTKYLSKIHLWIVLSRKLSFHVQLKWKVYLKLWISHYCKGSSPKTAIHTINNKTKYLRNIHEWAHFWHTTCNSTRNGLPTGIPQVYLKWITISRKTLEWLLPNIAFTIKVKILLTKFGQIYR